jgi:hypothetical protein
MNNKLSEASTLLQECIKSLKGLYVKAEPDDDKPIFSSIIDRLNKVDNLINSIENKDTGSKTDKWDEFASECDSFTLESRCSIMISKKPEKSPYSKDWYCKECFGKQIKSQLKPQIGLLEYVCPNSEKHSIWITDHEVEIIRKVNNIPPNPPSPEIKQRITWG